MSRAKKEPQLMLLAGEDPVVKQKAQRRALDAYYTPKEPTERLLNRYPQIQGGPGSVLCDPSCGDGYMGRRIAHLRGFETLVLNDINQKSLLAPLDGAPAAPNEVVYCKDMRSPFVYEPVPDWGVTNVPFYCAGTAAKAMIDRCRWGVAVLVRCTLLEPRECLREPQNNRKWLKDLPPYGLIAMSRISFTGDGLTDSAPAFWLIWIRESPFGPWLKGTVDVEDLNITDAEEALQAELLS